MRAVLVLDAGMGKVNRLRFGLCCKFHGEPIAFRTATAASLGRLSRAQGRLKLSEICMHNALTLMAALRYCAAHGIGAFRVNSQILPLKTHPDVGYDVGDLPDGRAIVEAFRACGRFAGESGLRTLFHPDQFIVLSSADRGLVARSIADIEYQSEVADWIGADVINLHGGGGYGDKAGALARVAYNIGLLSAGARRRLTLENDEKVYTPRDLLPVCEKAGVPLVYDVHHHRCLPDGLDVEEATGFAAGTWDREQVLHVSSPRGGWRGGAPSYHADYIDVRDFPACWRGLVATVEVEAKAKELAVLRLMAGVRRRGRERGRGRGVLRAVQATAFLPKKGR